MPTWRDEIAKMTPAQVRVTLPPTIARLHRTYVVCVGTAPPSTRSGGIVGPQPRQHRTSRAVGLVVSAAICQVQVRPARRGTDSTPPYKKKGCPTGLLAAIKLLLKFKQPLTAYYYSVCPSNF